MLDLNKLCKMSLADATRRTSNGADIGAETRKMLRRCSAAVVEAVVAYERQTYLEENAPFSIAGNE